MALDPASLPPEASRLYLRVVASAAASGLSSDDAAALAERGLANAGWTNDGKTWVREAKALSPRPRTDGAVGFETRVPIVSVAAKGEGVRFFGVASRAATKDAELVVDKHRDIIEPKELEAAAYDAVKSGLRVDMEHGAFDGSGPEIGALIESAYLDAEKRVALGGDGTGPVEWWTGFEVQPTSDDAVAAIKGLRAGTHRELSIEYSAERVVLPEDQPGKSRWQKLARALIKDSGRWGRPVGRLRHLRITRIGLVQAGAGEGVIVPLVKADRSQGAKMDLMEQLNALLATLPEDQQKLITDALAAAAQGKEAQPPAPPPPKMSAEVKALFDEQARRAKESDAKAAKMAAELEAIKEAQELERFAKAADAMTWLPVERVEMAKMLRYIESAPDGVKKQLKSLLETCDRLLKHSAVFETFGRTGDGSKPSTPYATLRAKADELRAAQPQLSEHEAFLSACKALPDVYQQHRVKARE